MFGDIPVLTGEAEVAAYLADLLTTRNSMQEAYTFDPENAANW
jgi:hypothetical protein